MEVDGDNSNTEHHDLSTSESHENVNTSKKLQACVPLEAATKGLYFNLIYDQQNY